MCTKFPKYASKCKAFVDEYEKIILKMIQQELNPDQICKTLGFCDKGNVQPLVASVHLFPSKSSAEEGMFSFLLQQGLSMFHYFKMNHFVKKVN